MKMKLILIFMLLCFLHVNSFAQLKIGVALPLMRNSGSSEEKKMGEQMLKGINDALSEYNTSGPEGKVSLKIEDTKRDQTATLQAFNKFGSESDIIAVLGPVFSSELVNNAGAGKFHQMCIITPTATHNSLAADNEYVFQLNPTYDVRGRLMAKYAMNELGMSNFLIFSEDTYGKNFSEGFIDEVKKQGRNILSEKYYSKDANTITEDLDDLRNEILSKEKFIDFGNLSKSQKEKLKDVRFKYSYLDSLIDYKLMVSIYKLLGSDADRFLDSIDFKPQSNADKTKPLIFGIADAIYMPIANASEMSKVASQYFSSNINLPIIGTSDWNNEKYLNENRMYIPELYFESDFYIEEHRATDMSESELKNYLLGYDSMKLILDEIAKGNTTRESLNDALQQVSDYKTVHNSITIKNRTNHQMSIMLFRNGELTKLSDYIY